MTLPTSGLITVNDRGARAATTFGSVAAVGGNMVFIKKLTASSSGTLSFVDGASSVVLDSTYKEYVFTFKDIHPSASARLQFQGSTDGGSNYGTTITSTMFRAYHKEDDSETNLVYTSGNDLAQSTSFQDIYYNGSSPNNDTSNCGIINLFNPSSDTFVKHFISTSNSEAGTNGTSTNFFTSGYFNTTSAINGIRFQMNTGNIDAGDICLYGIL